MIIRWEELAEEDQAPRPVRLRRFIERERHGTGVSLSWVRASGRHDRIVSDSSDRMYYAVTGEGVFEIGSDPPLLVAPGEVVLVPRGTPYDYAGNLTLILANGPAFVRGSDRRVPADETVPPTAAKGQHFRLADLPDIRTPGRELALKRVITREQHSELLSVTWANVWGRHERVVCDSSDRAYYISSGQGVFDFADERSGPVRAGDVVSVPRGTPYWYQGDLTLLSINGPAYVDGADRRLD